MKLNKQIGIAIAAAVILIILLYSSSYIVTEGHQVVITEFGKPVKSVKEAGLHFKLPFIQDVRRIDLRILIWDGFPNQIPTKDKKYIEVDTTARWKIVDPLKFIQTVQDERGAKSRLDAILDGITRDVISGHNLVEAVRNSNTILDVIDKRKKEINAANKKTEDQRNEVAQVQEEVTGEVESIEIGREQLSALIIENAKKELLPLGIELIDVQLKRIAYEDSVQQKVYGRMISERERIAERILSYGKGEQAKIEGKTDKDLKSIESEAYRKVQEIKGRAEGESINIYANTLSQSPDFYRFVRSLEAYEKAIPKESKLLLSSKSRFWEVLRSGDSK
jgi:modulator of FtsH protease HflC